MSKVAIKAADELKNKIVSIAGIELEKAQSGLLSKSIKWHLEFDNADSENVMILYWEAIDRSHATLEYLVEKWVYDTGKLIKFNIVARAN